MDPRVLNIGVVGCGAVSKVHFHVLSRMENLRLVACCDIIEERARAKAAEFGGEVVTDWRRLLDWQPRLDAVHILTPHALHPEMAIAFLEAGVNVLSEKPMAITVGEARQMIAVQDRVDAVLGVIFQNRYNPGFRAAQAMLRSGELGKLRGGRLNVTWGRDESYYETAEWRGKWRWEGGGALMNQAIHSVDQFLCLMGEVECLRAHVALWNNAAIEVEDTGVALLKFRSGIRGTMHCSNTMTTSWIPNEITLALDQGYLSLMGDNAFILPKGMGPARMIDTAPVDPVVGKVDWGVSHAVQIDNFYQSLFNGHKPDITGREAFAAVEVLRGMLLSQRRGGEVIRFPFEDDGLFPELTLGEKL